MNFEEKVKGQVWQATETSPNYKTCRVFNFLEDTAYGNNLNLRVHSAIKACLAPLIMVDGFTDLAKVPKFNPEVKVRITLEILNPADPIELGETADRDARAEWMADVRRANEDMAAKVKELEAELEHYRVGGNLENPNEPFTATHEQGIAAFHAKNVAEDANESGVTDLMRGVRPAEVVTYTRTFLGTQNTQALDAICDDLAIPQDDRGGTRATRITAILAKQE